MNEDEGLSTDVEVGSRNTVGINTSPAKRKRLLEPDDVVSSIEANPDLDEKHAADSQALLRAFQKPEMTSNSTKASPVVHTSDRVLSSGLPPGVRSKQSQALMLPSTELITSMKSAITDVEDLATRLGDLEKEQKSLLRV